MESQGDHRRRVAELVAARRKHLGLSVSRAATRAGIHRATWNGIEDGNRETEIYIYGPVERVLGWAPGSLEAILAGGEPRDAEEAELPAGEPAGAAAAVRQIRMILESDLAADFSAETKLVMIRDVIARDVPDDAVEGVDEAGQQRRSAAG